MNLILRGIHTYVRTYYITSLSIFGYLQIRIVNKVTNFTRVTNSAMYFANRPVSKFRQVFQKFTSNMHHTYSISHNMAFVLNFFLPVIIQI